jgi:hypothetical protein
MWDVMNEPPATSDGQELDPGREEYFRAVWDFVRHFCGAMKALDPEHPITVGVAYARCLEEIGADVDVLSFHDYSHTRARMRRHIEEGVALARAFEKPVLISETGCLARANPYDVALEICQELGIGWYLWELMIGVNRFWREIHGVVYPDGTVRDPSIAAAIRGFYRKRSGDVVAPNVDKEGIATQALSRAEAWLGAAGASFEEGLENLERIANLLEAGEIMPLNEVPSAKVLSLTEETAANRAELCRLLVLWGETLRHHCLKA